MKNIKAGSPSKVLIVEDDVLVRDICAEFLAEAGFSVIEAGNAEEALRALDADPGISVLFTDVEMPGALDGIALSWRVRERWPHVSVMVTSGRVLPRADHIPRDGHFLQKPYSADALINQVAACLARSAPQARVA